MGSYRKHKKEKIGWNNTQNKYTQGFSICSFLGWCMWTLLTHNAMHNKNREAILTAGRHLNKPWTMVRKLQEHLREKKNYICEKKHIARFPNVKFLVAFQSCGFSWSTLLLNHFGAVTYVNFLHANKQKRKLWRASHTVYLIVCNWITDWGFHLKWQPAYGELAAFLWPWFWHFCCSHTNVLFLTSSFGTKKMKTASVNHFDNEKKTLLMTISHYPKKTTKAKLHETILNCASSLKEGTTLHFKHFCLCINLAAIKKSIVLFWPKVPGALDQGELISGT